MNFYKFTTTLTFCLVASVAMGQNQPGLQEAEAGQAAIKSGNLVKAIELLQKAVELAPDNATFHNQLALAYFRNDELPKMWTQLREGAKVDPGHPEIAKGLLAYWNMFDKQGLFNVGNPKEDIVEVLGEPDADLSDPNNDSRGRLIYAFLAVDLREGKVHQVLDLRGLKQHHFMPQEIVDVIFDNRGWTPSYRMNNRYSTACEFTLPNEKIQEWTELFSIQRLHDRADSPAIVDVAKGMMDSLAKTNPDRKYRIIEADEESVLFEWTTGGNQNSAAQHEIVRLFKAERDIHRVAYVKKTNQLDEEPRERWVKILQAAKLKPVNVQDAKRAPKSNRSETNAKLAAWELGRLMSAAAMLHFQGNEVELAKRTFNRAKVVAAAVSIELDDFEDEPSEIKPVNAANCMKYCMATCGADVHQKLLSTDNRQVATLFELSIKANLLRLIYQPGDSLGVNVAAAITERAEWAGFEDAEWQPLVKSIEGRNRANKLSRR